MVKVITLGCRINSYESEVLKEKLGSLDNVIIINTCAVTGEAERQCRQTVRKLRKQNPDAKILLLTTFADDEYILKAIQLGAKGYILKQEIESIAPALYAVENGQTVFGGEIMNRIPNIMTSPNHLDPAQFDLTDKEFSIIELVAEGLNNKEIASQLYLSEGTVRNYISTILLKLNLRDRTQLACFYYKNR